MDTTIAVRISVELRQKLQALADADKRKLSDFIRIHLEKIADQKPAGIDETKHPGNND